MKPMMSLIAALAVSWMATAAHADWGHGLRREYKSPHVPSNQQGGWWIDTDADEVLAATATLDSDKDGVADPTDECEGTAAGVKVDSRGCPANSKGVPADKWTLEGIRFETGSDRIEQESLASLKEAADILRTHTRVKVEIQGHTDNVGGPAINQPLSEKRAAAVKKYLVDHGVAASRLETRGFGEKKPVAGNDSDAGRAKNRRIEFKVLKR